MRRIALLLTAAVGTVALLAFFYPRMMVNAADTTPPDTTIESGPSGNVTVTTAIFEFISNEQNSTFKCRLLPLESSRTNCTSPRTYPNLKVGTEYTFKVWAKDTAGNIDTTPATRTFTPTDGGSDPDTDGDGVPDSTDQCDTDPGPAPTGCPSDPGADRDADTIPDTSDNCDCVPNKEQVDTDGDGIGDACDMPVPPPTSSEFLVGAGDISSGGNRDQETGNLIDKLRPHAWGVFTTGDNAYPDGTYLNYQVYDAAWGCFKDMTRPTYGNHDYYGSSTAVGSEQYWNEAPDPTPVEVSNGESFYAYDVGSSNWRAIVLNSASTEGPTDNLAPDCKPGSPQYDDFLLPELANARTNNKNTVLFWHHARFSSSKDHPTSEGATGCSQLFFDAAHDNGADLVVQGHSHLYERYDTLDKTGAKVAGGLTSIVCGTGGNSFDDLQLEPSPTPDVAFTDAWGVCKLTLNTNSAQVDFLPGPLPAPGSPGSDSATVAVRP